MIRTILFDIDDTLLSFEGYVRQSMRDGFEKFGIGKYEDGMFSVFDRINSGLWREIEAGTLTFEELKKIRWNRIFDALGVSFDGPTFETYFRSALNESAIPEPGAMEVLRSLSGKYLLFAASNGPFAQQKHRLEIAGMLPLFSDLFISEEIGASKPSAAFFDVCVSRLASRIPGGVARSEILMVGDSPTSDLRGGIDAGFVTCFYNRKGILLPPETVPDFTVSSLSQIPAFLSADFEKKAASLAGKD